MLLRNHGGGQNLHSVVAPVKKKKRKEEKKKYPTKHTIIHGNACNGV
jgi:hypothetical protein